MKKNLICALVVLLLAVALIGADSYQGIPEESVTRFIPNQVDIYLPSNPTTGYSWTCVPEDPEIVGIQDQYFEDSHELGFVGSGGTHWFHLSGLKPGITSVAFRYARPWETNQEAEQTVYRLSVDELLNVLIWGVEVS